MNLYELTAEQRRIESMLEETGGELTPEIEEALNNNELALTDKVVNIRQIVTTVEASNDAIDAEIKRLQALKKSNTNAVKSLKNWILYVMRSQGINKIETPLFKLGFRTTKAVEIQDEGELLLIGGIAGQIDRWQKQLPDYITLEAKVSKSALKPHLEAGEDIYGAIIIENTSLTIK